MLSSADRDDPTSSRRRNARSDEASRDGREIVNDDAVGPGEPLARVTLALGDLGRGAAGHDGEGEQA
jgi:hypothetical protein